MVIRILNHGEQGIAWIRFSGSQGQSLPMLPLQRAARELLECRLASN